jgi:hypothetical protein
MRLAFLGLLLLVCGALFANPTGTLNNDANPTCWGGASMDQCFHSGDWWGTTTVWNRTGGSTTIISCGLSEGCATCVQNPYGKLVCGYGIFQNASCSCKDVRPTGAAPGITICQETGTCVYRTAP